MNKINSQHLRYRLYARKSTDDNERQQQSLADQIKTMKAVASRENLRIIGEPLKESKSAKLPNARPVFSELLREIEDGEIDGIICWKLDRLSRNPTDSGRIQQLLQDGKLKHILTNDRNYYPEDNAIVFSVEAGMSNQYIRELSSNTKRGMRSKAEKGDKPGKPPIGYLNDRNTRTIIADPKRFKQVRILWDKMLTGTYSVAELTEIADKELHIRTLPLNGKIHKGNRPIAYSSLHAMFKMRFYTGKLPYNGKLLRGNHPPMITEEEFERVQQIIDPTHTTRPKNKVYNFPFRNLFRCGECGYAITAEQKQKYIKSTGQTRQYTYYHCTGKSKTFTCNQQSLHINEDELTRQLKQELSKYTVDPDFYKLAIEALAQQEDEVVEKDQAITEARDKAINKIELSIANLRRMRYSGEADDDSWFFSEMKALESSLENLQSQRNKAEYKARDWRAQADEVFSFARYAKEDFDSDDLEKKRTVVVRLGEAMTLLDRTVRFTPNKYLIPIEKMNESQLQLSEMVRTDSQQGQIGSKDLVITSWLRLVETLRTSSEQYEDYEFDDLAATVRLYEPRLAFSFDNL